MPRVLDMDRRTGRPCPNCGERIPTVGDYLSHIGPHPDCMAAALAGIEKRAIARQEEADKEESHERDRDLGRLGI